MTIRGYDAFRAAKELRMPLGKYSEKSHLGSRLDLSVEDTDELAVVDEDLVFLNLDINSLGMDELIALSIALGGEPGQSLPELRDQYEQGGDDDRADVFDTMARRWSALKLKSH